MRRCSQERAREKAARIMEQSLEWGGSQGHGEQQQQQKRVGGVRKERKKRGKETFGSTETEKEKNLKKK